MIALIRRVSPLRSILILAFTIGVVGCERSSGGALSVTEILPDRGEEGQAIPVVIRGENLRPDVSTDFTTAKESRVDARFEAFLGETPLREVALDDDGALTGIIPESLPPGLHSLRVRTPSGQEAVLEEAYRSLSSDELDALVERFEFAPIDSQTSFAPFDVVITAVDVRGERASAFNGTITLSDLTGTVVPRTLTMVRGQWVGRIELRSAHAANVLTASGAREKFGSSAPFAVLPQPAATLRFSSPAREIVAGTCSGEVVIDRIDDFGAPVAAATELPITLLASPSAGFDFYSDPGCTQSLTAPQLAANASSLRVYFRGTRAGEVSVSAEADGLLGATQVHRITPDVASAIVFTSPAQVLNAGACSQPAVVSFRDAFDNATTLEAPGALELSANPAAGFSFHASASCGATVSSVALSSGATEATFFFRGDVAGTRTISAALAGLASATQSVRVNPEGFATRLVFVTPEQTVTAGVCSGVLAAQTQDSFGNAVSNTSPTQILLGASPATGFAFFADDACTQPLSGVAQIPAGSSAVSLFFRGEAAGTVRVTGNAGGLSEAAQNAVIRPAGPSRLAFTTPARLRRAGECSEVLTVQVQDAFGNPTAVGAGGMLNLAAAPNTGFTFHSDAACLTTVTTASVPSGSTSGSFYFRGTSTGTVRVSVSGISPTGTAQDQTIQGAAAAQIAFTGNPQTVAAGACSGVENVQLQDAFGNPATSTSATSLALSASPSTGVTLYSDAACGTAVTQISVPPGQSSGSFFFRAQRAGSLTLTASSTLGSDTQGVTVQAAPPSRIALTSTAQSLTAGQCSQPLAFRLEDEFGNVSPTATPLTVTLSGEPSDGLTFHATLACGAATTTTSVGAGSSSGTAFFRGTRAGTAVLTLSANGYVSGTQNANFSAASADRVVFTTPARTAAVGACSAVLTLQSQDGFGNPSNVTGATLITLARAPPSASFRFYSDATCATQTSSVSIPSGSRTASFYFQDTSPGSATLSATPVGLTGTTQAATVSAADAPSQLVFLTPERTRQAGGCSDALTIQSQDPFGNPRPVNADTAVTLSIAPTANIALYTNAGCTDAVTGPVTLANGSSDLTFYFRGTQARSHTATASAPGLNAAQQPAHVVAANPVTLAFTTSAQTLRVDTCSQPVTVETRDGFGNPAPTSSNLLVDLVASPSSGFAFHAASGCTGSAVTQVQIASGTSSTTFSFRGTRAGQVLTTASASGVSPADQTHTLQPGSPTRLVVLTTPQTQQAGACSGSVVIESRDAFDNPAPVAAGTSLTLAAAPSTNFTFHPDASGCAGGSEVTTVSISANTSQARYRFRGTRMGAVTMSIDATGFEGTSQMATISAATASRLVFRSLPQSVVAGVCSGEVRVESQDAFGNPSAPAGTETLSLSASPSTSFAFFSDAACGSGTAPTIANPSSEGRFFFRGQRVGVVTLTAGSTNLASSTQDATIVPAAPSAFVWDPIGSPQARDFGFGVVIRTQDAFGNATPSFNGTASLSVTPGSVALSCPSCDSGLSATFQSGVWSGTVAVGAPAGTNRTLTATSGSVVGTSNAFDVELPALLSPPVARFTVNPAVVILGTAIQVDASGSSDGQSPASTLEVAWDFTSTATAPAPSTGWSTFTTVKTASHTFGTTGVKQVRLAVRDPDGQIEYASGTVEVVSPGTVICRVDTNSDVSDGATNCSGSHGTDGLLSLAEAVSLSNSLSGEQIITFAGPMTITANTASTFTSAARLIAPSGVQLSGKRLNVSGGVVAVRNLRFESLTTAPTVTGGTLQLLDSVFTNSRGITVSNSATLQLTRVRMQGCTTDCVRVESANLSVNHSRFFASATGVSGIRVATCPIVFANAHTVRSSTFYRLDRGVRTDCADTLTLDNNTFHANEVGFAFNSNSGHTVRNNIFTAQKIAAASCSAVLLGSSTTEYHVLPAAGPNANATTGTCVATTDANTLTSDPQYFQTTLNSEDLRLQPSSAARDSARNLGLDLNDAAPGNFHGSGPDRGGQESP